MKKVGIILAALVVVSAFFGCGCIDTPKVDDVNLDEPAAMPVVPLVEEPVVTLAPPLVEEPVVTLAPPLVEEPVIPKYKVGDVIGKDIAGIVGCVIVSYSELGDMYAVKIIVNKEGTWMYYNTASETTRMAGRARMEETYPVLLAHISVQDIPMMKQKDAEISSKSTHRDVFEWMHIVGEVKNTGIETLEFVKVIATIYDKDGTVIGTAFAYTTPHTISKNDVAPFDVLYMNDVPAGAKYKLVVNWL